MKMRRDMVTGIVGLLTCVFFCFMTLQVRQPAKLLEPGPRLLPFVALLAVTEGTRSAVYGMEELELATRFSLKSVLLARLCLVGTCTPSCCSA